MNPVKVALLLVSILNLASAEEKFQKLVLLKEELEQDTFSNLETAKKYAGAHLFEVRNATDLLDITMEYYDHVKEGVWLGNKYSDEKGGWYNPSTGEKNDLLNHYIPSAPTCPKCCLQFTTESGVKEYKPMLYVVECSRMNYGIYGIFRSKKTPNEAKLDQLVKQFKKIVSQGGDPVIIPQFGNQARH